MTATLEGLRVDVSCPSCGELYDDPEAPHECVPEEDEPHTHAGVIVFPMDTEPPLGVSYVRWRDQRYAARRGLRQALIRLRVQRDVPNCAGDSRPHDGSPTKRREVTDYLCPSCPIREACRKAGEGERWGVWGGVDRSNEGIDGKRR